MGGVPVIAEAAPWSLRSLRAASAITGILSAKADTSICCQHLVYRTPCQWGRAEQDRMPAMGRALSAIGDFPHQHAQISQTC